MVRSRAIAAVACVSGLLWAASLDGSQPSSANGDRVVLITLDGARTQEVFGGLDVAILKSTLKKGELLDANPTYERFWAATPEERRRKLMPFFWGTLMANHGSIAGNRALGSRVSLTNHHWFSYPGYAEILLGEPHDEVIKSNDPIRNPHTTVLEVMRERLALPPAGVAAFASWGVFNHIVEHAEGALTVDAGPHEPMPEDSELQELARLQAETLPPWDNVRSDVFTFRLAMHYFERARPRVVYLAFDETDDWAHDRRYDRLLDAYARTDRYLEQLWTWLQNDPEYRGRTHLLITTDHGRGRTTNDWNDHGAKIDGADEVWIAFASPAMTARGEWRAHEPLTTSQIAATLASWVGIDWKASRPNAGPPIS
jgi:hypothetical protein